MAIDVTKVKDEVIRRALYEIGDGLVALTSPSLGAATATSINKVAITAPAASATLTIANTKTLTVSKTMTLTCADDTAVVTLPTGATSLAPLVSPSFTTPTLGVATATSINKVAITAPATSATLTIADGKTLTASKTMTLTCADDTAVVTLPAGTNTLAQLASPSFTDPITNMTKVSTSVLTKNANTTFALIPGLTVSLVAGKTYVIRGHLTITASNASGGIKVAIATPDTLTLTSGSMTGLNVNNATLNATTTATALATAFGHATAAVTDVWFEGAVVVNAAGTLEIHAAQNASHASDMTVGVNSTLTVIRIN